MKPKINQDVYVFVYRPFTGSILYKTKAVMIGAYGFITPHMLEEYAPPESRQVYKYYEYNVTWFTNLKKAQKVLKDFQYDIIGELSV